MLKLSPCLSRSASIALAATTAVLFGWVGLLLGGWVKDPDDLHAAKWDAMIDAIANRNPRPEMVEFGQPTDFDSKTIPLFSPDYDWREQERVRRALARLIRNDSPELWERLVKHVDDERYALTTRYNEADYDNYTVGRFCHIFASRRLDFVRRWYSEPGSGDRPDVYLEVGIDDIAKWRKERAKKSLYELQIEVCETALKQVVIVKGVSEKAKVRIRKEIQAKIAELKKTKKPFYFDISMDSYEFFNAERANKAREIIKKPNRK